MCRKSVIVTPFFLFLSTDPLPTVTALIRGAFGRHAWTMQLRHSPRVSKVSASSYCHLYSALMEFSKVNASSYLYSGAMEFSKVNASSYLYSGVMEFSKVSASSYLFRSDGVLQG